MNGVNIKLEELFELSRYMTMSSMLGYGVIASER